MSIYLKVKFRAFGITFGTFDETLPVPQLPSALALLLGTLERKQITVLDNVRGITLRVLLGG